MHNQAKRWWAVGVGLLACGAVTSAYVGAAESAQIVSFTPQGLVPEARQVHATFSEAMIHFGDQRVEPPFTIQCAAKGTARWADPKNWVFDFEEDLQPGVQCTYKVKDGLKSLAGHEIAGPREFTFTTGGPSIQRTRPSDNSQVHEDQAFILGLGGPVEEDTVRSHAWFNVEGIQERIELKIVDGKEREEILDATYGYNKASAKFQGADKTAKKREAALIVQARRPFPPGKKITLVWGQGIASKANKSIVTTAEQSFEYRVRDEFSARFNCERENADAPCLPFTQMRLDLSAPVSWKEYASKIRLKGPKGEWKPAEPADAKKNEALTVEYVTFTGPFPEESKFKLQLPGGLVDDSDRKLSNADKFPLEVGTGPYPPLAKFAAPFGIIEAKADPALPVTVRNIEKELTGKSASYDVQGRIVKSDTRSLRAIVDWMYAVSGGDEYKRREHSIFDDPKTMTMKPEAIHLPRPEGGKAFEVMGIPLSKPGFYVVELESRVLGQALMAKPAPMYVAAAALVTDLSVHFKSGREASLAWVTSLSEGQPVKGAHVALRDCNGQQLAEGTSDADGLVKLPGLAQAAPQCKGMDAEGKERWFDYDRGWFVTAEKDGDFSFVHSSWNRGIESWRFQLPGGWEHDSHIVHTVFDRTLLRAGEWVHMKHFARRHTMRGIEGPNAAESYKAVLIRHEGSNQTYEMPLKWNADGTATGDFHVPKEAKLGRYGVYFLNRAPKGKEAKKSDEDTGESEEDGSNARYESGAYAGSFRVEEFRVPLMKARIRTPSEKLVGARAFDVQLSAEYLAGGGASMLPVALRYQQGQASGKSFDDYEGWAFSNGKAKVRNSDVWEGGDEEGETDYTIVDNSAEGEGGKKKGFTRLSLKLDKTGATSAHVEKLKTLDAPSDVELEMEYRDPNGEIQTTASRVPLYPAAALVGVKTDGWALSKESLQFKTLVVDLEGKPLAGAPVEVTLLENRTFSHRKKLVGGFYAYDNRSELKAHGKICEGKTDAHGYVYCDAKPPVSGELVLQASTRDKDGRESVTHESVYVYENSRWWFSQDDSERMDLLPEKKRYEPNEKAVIQARMPFKEATALVTLEREGVIDAFVTKISGSKPVVEVPLQGNYAPNVFVSVFAVRGRSGDTQPTALVDLGKPAYKLGITELQVGWKAHELKVTVKPEQEVYRIREKAKVHVHVERATGEKLAAGSEVALAAVDEGLLQLQPNDSWKLLESMMGRRGYEVETMTAQSQVVGKRHYGLKALPTGGDGGKSPTRELFDTLLLWKARVQLDANGDADVTVPLNDSITSFRIAAVAHSGVAQFGTGEGRIRATQDLMILSGVAPIAREGDRFPAEFTVRNASAQPMEVELSARIPGKGEKVPKVEAKFALKAGESRIWSAPVEVPTGPVGLSYDVEARATDRKGVSDKIHIAQKVVPAIPVRTLQATLEQWGDSYKLEVERPKDAQPAKGGVRVVLQPTLVAGLDGVRDYMGTYPYGCLEQKTSVSVSLGDEKRWKEVMRELPAYLDGNGMAKFFPTETHGWDVLTSYVLAVSNEAGWEIPDTAREKMTEALDKFVNGSLTVDYAGYSIRAIDLTYRKLHAIEALSRYGLAHGSMLGSLEIRPDLWSTSALIDWHNILMRVTDAPDRAKRLEEARTLLKSRLTFTGSQLAFSTEKGDFLWWLLVSADENANRLLLAMLESKDWPVRAEELPRVARGTIQRQRRGHWDTTLANSWGALAIQKFAAEFEKAKVSGETQAKLGDATDKLEWSKKPKGGTLDLAWPAAGKGTLEAKHSGSGKPWAVIQSCAAIPLKESFNSGYRVTKTVTPVEQKTQGKYSRGDILRVRLDVDAQADMTWVVVNDPIPAGASILGGGLGGDSSLATQGEKREGWVWPIFEERAFEGYRAFYQWVPKGKFAVEYTVRLNQPGTMLLPPTRVEAMYSPEAFGEAPNDEFKIAE